MIRKHGESCTTANTGHYLWKRNNVLESRTHSPNNRSKHQNNWIGSFTKELELGLNQKKKNFLSLE